jgi:ADP-ribose pyrophosphatase
MGEDKKNWKYHKTYTVIKHNVYKNPNSGKNENYCIITFSKNGSGVVVALTNAKEIIFVEQYRPAVGNYVLNLPGGRIEKEKTLSQKIIKIKKELEEETFNDNKCWTTENSNFELLSTAFPIPTRLTDQCMMFFAKNVRSKKHKRFLEESAEKGRRIRLIPIKKVDMMIKTGRIRDMTTIAAILLAERKGFFKFD